MSQVESLARASNFPSPSIEVAEDEFRVAPWNADICTRCVHDYDCPGHLMLCGYDNCCVDRKCFDDDDCQRETTQQYYAIRGVNAESSNLNPLQPFDDPNEAARQCTMTPECVAYNSLGYLKDWIPDPSVWQIKPMVKGLPDWTLYLKRTCLLYTSPSPRDS